MGATSFVKLTSPGAPAAAAFTARGTATAPTAEKSRPAPRVHFQPFLIATLHRTHARAQRLIRFIAFLAVIWRFFVVAAGDRRAPIFDTLRAPRRCPGGRASPAPGRGRRRTAPGSRTPARAPTRRACP